MKILAMIVMMAAVMFTGAAHAAQEKAPKAPKPATLKGTVVSVAADGKVTVKVGKKDAAKDIVIETNDKTEVTIEGNTAKVSDLKAGQQVVITPAEGTATKIEVPQPKAKAPKAPKAPKTPKPEVPAQ